MRKIAATLIFSFSLASTVSASPITEARDLLASGQKKAAWQTLYPVAQEDGEGEAKFLLGHLLLTSPEIDNHLKKSLLYFRAALADGYAPSQQAISATEARISAHHKASANRHKSEELYRKNASSWKAYSEKVDSGFITPEGTIVPHQLSVFVRGASQITSEVQNIIRSTTHLSESIQVKYMLVLDRKDMGQMDIFPDGYAPPPGGFEPDFDGIQAEKFRINSYPALVLQTSKKTQPQIISLAQFRNWAVNWSPTP